MKAVVLTAKSTVEFSELPEPQLKGPEDVLVRLEAVSLCETDEKVLDGSTSAKKFLAQLAKLRGAKVVGVDIIPAKLELAKSAKTWLATGLF